MKRYVIELIYRKDGDRSRQVVECEDIRAAKKYVDNTKKNRNISRCTVYEVTPIVFKEE